jgi:hypothetical protein
VFSGWFVAFETAVLVSRSTEHQHTGVAEANTYTRPAYCAEHRAHYSKGLPAAVDQIGLWHH